VPQKSKQLKSYFTSTLEPFQTLQIQAKQKEPIQLQNKPSNQEQLRQNCHGLNINTRSPESVDEAVGIWFGRHDREERGGRENKHQTKAVILTVVALVVAKTHPVYSQRGKTQKQNLHHDIIGIAPVGQ
jgi:hypothetical protein